MNRIRLEDAIVAELRERSLEEILEDFDITPEAAVWALYSQGLIDDEILDKLYGSYEG